jgi:hypothetical protein
MSEKVIQGTTVEEDYVVGDGPVTLAIEIGDGQIGGSAVFLNHVVIAKGNVELVHLGSGPAIAGQPLGVRTIVTDIREQTNRTDVTYTLSGGEDTLIVTLEQEVENDGDSISYIGVFHLKGAQQ